MNTEYTQPQYITDTSDKYWAFQELSPLPWGVRRSGQSAPGRSRRRPAAPGCSQSDPRAWTPSRNAQVHGIVTCSPVNAPTLAGFGKTHWKKENYIQYTVKNKCAIHDNSCNFGLYIYWKHLIFKNWDSFFLIKSNIRNLIILLHDLFKWQMFYSLIV